MNRAFPFVVAVALAACRSSTPPPLVPSEIAAGTWGGDTAAVIVNDTLVHVHVACTFGDIAGRVALDATGHFSATGTYVLRAYPVYVGPELPARFTGVVSGDHLTIAVAVNDTTTGKAVALGPVTVTLGADPKMGPCPICRTPGDRARMRRRAP